MNFIQKRKLQNIFKSLIDTVKIFDNNCKNK